MIRYDRTLILLLASNFLASVGTGVAMIAIPWLLATRSDGGVLFGVLMTLSNVGLVLATPFVGVMIDRLSRKRFMISLRLAFLVGLGIVFFLGKWDEGETFALVVYYLLGASFYVINIPLRTAFVQELYYDRDYSRVNSILEIENQAAAVAIGAVAIGICCTKVVSGAELTAPVLIVILISSISSLTSLAPDFATNLMRL